MEAVLDTTESKIKILSAMKKKNNAVQQIQNNRETEEAISRIKCFLHKKKELAASSCLAQFLICMVFVYML